ncbi:helix-turn-helix transcriptional regulator [Lachnotalea glycerini]|uniref:AraC family transcriptional regulator n=1 Tax=Lachnotalea glycerini TaxID=1763509 RepID=A0A371JHM0_9FIRM|nr:helix-turn-helix domain-containing protein [Lachnotalea glycerini]RDY32177.1 AraC family transcriptional regulator [Lachnotalea glycerini]
MIDQASMIMTNGKCIAAERILGVNDNMIKSHYHDYFELYYLESGQRYHMVQDRSCCMNTGEFIIFPPYKMHHSYGDNDVAFKRLVVYFKTEAIMIHEITEKLKVSARVYRLADRSEIYSLLKEILKEQEKNDIYSDEAMQMLLNHLLIKIVRLEGAEVEVDKQNRITQIIHYLHKNYTENITLDMLASQFYLSTYYLCREFKHYTNSTIIQYINHIRISQAQLYLMETDKSITQISSEVGFSNVTHFDRVFKTITGISPSAMKKQIAGKRKRF